MKPLLFKIKESDQTSFEIRHEKVSFFENPWHYHPEFELNYIIKSKGLRFIGDSIEAFAEGDLVLLGSNIPHYWRNHDEFYANKTENAAEAIVMRFRANLWGDTFLETPEMKAIKDLFGISNRGILFSENTTNQAKEILFEILNVNQIEKIILWLRLFEVLAKDTSYKILSKKTLVNQTSIQDDRMTRVLNFIQNNLTNEIDLDEVAQVAHMNRSAFCRFFKQKTNKTLSNFINELRISLACRLLLESKDDIVQIAFASGFQDVSYFNQVFRAFRGDNPSGFRRSFEMND
jgi:AraC-like DNA-binding protein